jgi:IS4 transposase
MRRQKSRKLFFEKKLAKDEHGVWRIDHIHLKYKKEKQEKTLCLRLVYYRDEQGRKYKFITNNWDITAEEVALIYKCRWTSRNKSPGTVQLSLF